MTETHLHIAFISAGGSTVSLESDGIDAERICLRITNDDGHSAQSRLSREDWLFLAKMAELASMGRK